MIPLPVSDTKLTFARCEERDQAFSILQCLLPCEPSYWKQILSCRKREVKAAERDICAQVWSLVESIRGGLSEEVTKLKVELPKREDSYEFTLHKCLELTPSQASVEKVVPSGGSCQPVLLELLH